MPRRAVPLALALVVLLGGSGCRRGAPEPAARVAPASGTLPAGVDATVRRVVDGDTLEVSGGERIRLIGIDTPETKAPNQPVGCFGEEASRFATSLLPPGTAVRMVGDVEQRDRFGRLLAYVYRLPDGLFVNAELLRQGFAQVLTVPPNVAHADEFAAIARQAREGSQGLWAACANSSSSRRVGAG